MTEVEMKQKGKGTLHQHRVDKRKGSPRAWDLMETVLVGGVSPCIPDTTLVVWGLNSLQGGSTTRISAVLPDVLRPHR